jgi:nicotinamidase-related amidase
VPFIGATLVAAHMSKGPTMSSLTVLLVIDLQQCLVAPPLEDGPRSTPLLTTNVRTILTRWQELHYPLIHINHHASNPMDPLHPSHQVTSAPHSCAKPLPNETIRYKSTGSAFIGAHGGKSLLENLEAFASPAGEQAKLVIIGMDGAQCVNSTTRSAADLGFDVTVVADACASFGTQDWRRGEAKEKGWSAEETHDVAMAILAGGYARVVSTEELTLSLN